MSSPESILWAPRRAVLPQVVVAPASRSGSGAPKPVHVEDDAPKRRAPLKPEINVTPLVDVVLVLLIIFMVVTPQMEAGVSVKLPQAAHAESGAHEAKSPITLSVTAQGRLFLEKDPMELEALTAKLKAMEPGTPLVVKADEGAPYGKVRTLVRALRDAGLSGASLQVLERKGGG